MKLIFTAFLVFTFNLHAQVNQEWIQRYNGSGNSTDMAESIAVDDLGNVYVTGQSVSTTGNFNCLTIKYDINGNEIWAQEYIGTGDGLDKGNAIAVDKFGNVFITGETEIPGGNRNYLTIKYDLGGFQQWASEYNGPGNSTDAASSIVLDNSGNVYVTGFSWGSGTTTDYATIKYDSYGNQQWVDRYNGPGNNYDLAKSIAIDAVGNIYVTGESIGNGTNSDFTTIKYDPLGNEQWVQSYHNSGTSTEGANSLYVDEKNNIYVTGTTDGDGTGTDYVTIKYNSDGAEQWLQKYNGPGNNADIPYSIIADDTGNVFVTGYSIDIVGGRIDADYTTIKYNTSGAEQWIQKYNGPADSTDYAYSIALDKTGNVYITGESASTATGSDYATVKYSSSGVELWVQRYNGQGNGFDYAWDIALDSMGNVYVTGGSNGNGTGSDFATIKYSQPITDIIADNLHNAENFILNQNYPNPFNPSTVISYQLPVSNNVTLKVYDVLGREVATLVNEEKSAGSYEVEFDRRALASGIYFYQIKVGEYIQTKKMLLLK